MRLLWKIFVSANVFCNSLIFGEGSRIEQFCNNILRVIAEFAAENSQSAFVFGMFVNSNTKVYKIALF